MVDLTETYLIAVRYDLAVLVTEGTLHKIIVEVTENSLHVSILSELLENVLVLVVIPRESCCGVVFGHTELNVVTCVVESASYVNSAVAVRVKDILVLLDK